MRYAWSMLMAMVMLTTGRQSVVAQTIVRQEIRNGVEVVEGVVWPNFRTMSLRLLRGSTSFNHDAEPLQVNYWNDGAKEQFGDAAWIARQGFIPMVFVIKDANENTMCLEYLRLYRRVGGTRTLLQQVDANRIINADQFYYYGGFGTNEIGSPAPGLGDTALFEWELRFRDTFCSATHVSRYFNRVTVAQPLPDLSNWYRTDTHYHTRFTDNIFEFGGFMWMVRQSAEAVGLHVVLLTDHSTDIKTSLNEFGWNQLAAEADSLSDETVLLIPGEELTLDSDQVNQSPGFEDRIHLVASGLTRPLLAPEECCSQNSSGLLWTLRQGMDSVAVQNAVAMAAHPSRTFSVGYGGELTKWSDTNFDIAAAYPQFAGSEFYNEKRTVFNNTVENDDLLYEYDWQANPNWEDVWNEGLRDFMRLVQRYLSPMVRMFGLSGGSDAHGDLGRKYTNQYGITSKVVNDNAIGKVHTLVYSPSGLNQAGILDAIRNRHMVVSDGPAFTVWVDADGDGLTDGTIGGQYAFASDATIRLQGSSLRSEHGQFSQARIYHLTPSAVETTTVVLSGTTLNLTLPGNEYPVSGLWSAVMVNVRTANGFQATTSPIY
ncbi:MAG: PHP domain-containing protein, partial [Candidatus Kerfeldbacteria bacterium]|nr:PHP domain-containing protein [Candidatus Kerfeldbacteria bacterium]